MKIGLLSDTHDEAARTRVAVRQFQTEGVSTLFHCGDLTTPSILEICSVFPCYFVFGNHDADMASTLRESAKSTGVMCLEWGGVVTLQGVSIAVTHGHMTTDVRRLLQCKPHYLFSGHSHIPSDIPGEVRRINPGALHRAETYTVAILDLSTGQLKSIRMHE